MEIKKILLYVAAILLGVMIWTTWNKDYPSSNYQTSTQSSPVKASTPDDFTPPSYQGNTRKLTTSSTGYKSAKTPATTTPSAAPSLNQTISIKTDVLHLQINKQGGNIIQALLPNYPVSVKEKNTPVALLRQDPVNIAQSGITNAGQKKLIYSSPKLNYQLDSGEKKLVVTLTAKTKKDLLVTKTYILKAGKYAIKQTLSVSNKGSKTWKGNFYHQLTHKNVTKSNMFSRSYNGAAISTPKKPYEKLTFKDLSESNLSRSVEGGWVAMQEPYFLSAWVPISETDNHFYSQSFGTGSKGKGNTFILGYTSPQVVLAPGNSASNLSTLYVGPELESQLNEVAHGLDLTIDYGWLWFLSKPIFWVMSAIHSVVGNWGWSIILVTFLIKLIFYPLSAKSYKSMAKMREVAPRMQALRERYADDKQALGKATMEFYKKEKVSPAGGCLPMVVQIPVFIALYYVLMESVQLRQAPWIFWIQDLSVKDPYYILPILMGLSMLLQQKLSPPPPDPTQAKMMMFLPVIFTVFFLSFPAGLVLYWLTNNCLSIAQQWYVMKTFDPKKEKKKRKKKKR